MKKITFTAQARADVRRLDIPTAIRIFAALHRFAQTGQGDLKKLKGDSGESRLRAGDYRIRFIEDAESIIVQRSSPLESLPLSALALAPAEDEEITPETAAALDRARASLDRGEGIPHDDILREFGVKN